jgi:MoaA/NifB/PqqE/SkfB family radical SAM enzyme
MRPVDRLAGRIAATNLTELRVPYRITYALTYRCQLKCRMCNIWKKELAEELSVGQIAAFFSRAPDFSWINLTGGEIFLRSDVAEVMRAISANARNVYLINFPTNGYLTDVIVGVVGDYLQSPGSRRLMVTVSLDGPPHIHDGIRNMPDAWSRAVETFRQLRLMKERHRNFDVCFGMTLQDANVDSFEETVSSVRERIGSADYADFHVNVMHVSSHYYGNTACSMNDGRKMMERLCEIEHLRRTPWHSPVGFLERRYQKMAGSYLKTGRTPVPCQALCASVFMDPSGTVYPCTIYDSPLGNIRDYGYDLHRLWVSPGRLALRQKIVKGDCPQCWTPCEAYQSILANLLRPAAR